MQAWNLAKINNIPALHGFFICSYLYGSLKGICGFCSQESARRLDHKVDSFQNSTVKKKKTMKSSNWNQKFLVYAFRLLLAHFFNIYFKKVNALQLNFLKLIPEKRPPGKWF